MNCVDRMVRMAGVLLVLSAATTALSRELPGNMKIAYNMLHDEATEDYEVFIMDITGENQVNISKSAGVDWVYYAFRDKLFFVSDRDTCHRCYFLYSMDAAGEQIRRITDFPLKDSWLGSRKEGRELVVNPKIDSDSAFYIIDVNGNILQRVYTGLPYFSDPIFAPDGKQIVFRGATAPFKKDRGYRDELYLINVDGSGLQQLTHYPQSDTTAKWYSYHAGPPNWNSATNFISYNSFQNGQYRLFGIKPDGSGQRQITRDNINAGWHSWSPDGTWFAYDANSEPGSEAANYDVFLSNADQSIVRRLTRSAKYEQGPVFVEVKNPTTTPGKSRDFYDN